MKDQAEKTLKAYYKNELYHVGIMNTLEGKVQIAIPINENSKGSLLYKDC